MTRSLIDDIGPVDHVGVEERVAQFTTRRITNGSKQWALTSAVSMVDLTTLEGSDTPATIAALCHRARRPSDDPCVPPVAAVCIYPTLVKHARKHLTASQVKVASVAGAFPSGHSSRKVRLREVKFAIKSGADEIDMVINRGRFLSGDYQGVQDDIAAVVEACRHATLKVILEVGELETYDNIRAASFLAMQVLRPGDFLKTSTGKIGVGATLASTQVILEAVRDFYLSTGVPIGVKPAGGIRTAKQALPYLVAVKETLGDAWLDSSRYRFGARTLLDDLLHQIHRERTASPCVPHSFSEAVQEY